MRKLAEDEVFLSFKGAPHAGTAPDLFDERSHTIAELLRHELEENLQIKTFHFVHSVTPGAQFMAEITAAIKSVKCVIVLLSNAYVQVESEYCRHELSTARTLKKDPRPFTFRTDPKLDLADHSEILAGVSAPDVSDWTGGLGNPHIKSAMRDIAIALGRQPLIALIDLLAQPAGPQRDDDIIDWCFEHGEDPASAQWRMRLVRQWLTRREAANEANTTTLSQKAKEITASYSDALQAEARLLHGLRRKVADGGQVSKEDWRDLRNKYIVDLAQLVTASQTASERLLKLDAEKAELEFKLKSMETELGRIRADFSYVQAERDNLARQLARLKQESEEQKAEIQRLRDPDSDRLQALLQSASRPLAPAIHNNVLTAWKYHHAAQKLQHEEINQLARQLDDWRNREPDRARSRDNWTFDHFPAPAGSPGRYIGTLSFTARKRAGRHIRSVTGFFDQVGEFRGSGSIEFADDDGWFATFNGEIDRLSPKVGGYGTYKFARHRAHALSSWEGSCASTEAFGRLVFTDGSIYWGPTLHGEWGDIRQHGFGLMEQADQNGQDRVLASKWERGSRVANE